MGTMTPQESRAAAIVGGLAQAQETTHVRVVALLAYVACRERGHVVKQANGDEWQVCSNCGAVVSA